MKAVLVLLVNSMPFKIRERSVSNSSGILGINCNEELTQETFETTKTHSEIYDQMEIYNLLIGKFDELNDMIKKRQGKGSNEKYELLLEKYKGLYKGPMQLIERVNKENELRDMKWRGIIKELYERIGILNRKLNVNRHELEGYKSKCENVLNEMGDNMKEKQLE